MNISTEELAQQVKVKPESIRSRVCRTGSYFGLVPEKLSNNRLLWPLDAVELLKKSSSQK